MARYLFKCDHDGDYLRLHCKCSEEPERFSHVYWVNRQNVADWMRNPIESNFTSSDGYAYIEFIKYTRKICIILTHYMVCDRHITGIQDQFTISPPEFVEFVLYSDSGDKFKCLDIVDWTPPKIVVKAPEVVRKIAQHPIYRHKFAKFIGSHFDWGGATEIELYSDWVPYSFFFQEKCGEKNGMCGGVILHGQDDPHKAYYGIHT